MIFEFFQHTDGWLLCSTLVTRTIWCLKAMKIEVILSMLKKFKCHSVKCLSEIHIKDFTFRRGFVWCVCCHIVDRYRSIIPLGYSPD